MFQWPIIIFRVKMIRNSLIRNSLIRNSLLKTGHNEHKKSGCSYVRE